MRSIRSLFLIALLALPFQAQSFLQAMYDSERAFGQAVAEKGVKPAFLEFLADDAVIFRPEAVNGPEFLRSQSDRPPGVLKRTVTAGDISSNGMLGFTTGEWTLTQRTKTLSFDRVGQYATVWQKRQDGRYKAILDIEITHDPFEKRKKKKGSALPAVIETNFRGISVADAAMNFLKVSMTAKGLGGAYDKYADDDVRLLRDGMPPIEGRGRAKNELEKYVAIDFPSKVSQFESANLAYSWNPCSYADSNEGMEKGNCLHIWKLTGDKWKIVLGVFARVANQEIPELKEKAKKN